MKQAVSWRPPSVFHFKLSHLIPLSSLDAQPYSYYPLSSLHPSTISCGGEWKRGKRDFGSICLLLFAASVNKQPPSSQEVFLHQFLHSPANCRSADGQHSKRNASTIKTIKKTFEFSEHKEGR